MASSSSGSALNKNNNNAAGKAKATESGALENIDRPVKVISPELRGLLSRKVIVRKRESVSTLEEGKRKIASSRR